MNFDYGLRYDAKRDHGISELRSDGSKTSRETDVQAGAAEEFAAREFGIEPNRTIYSNRGDGGCDFMLGDATFDVVHMGFESDGGPRLTGNLIINVHEPWRHCDAYICVRGTLQTGFEILGWCSHAELIERAPRNFGYGRRYWVPIRELRPIAELQAVWFI